MAFKFLSRKRKPESHLVLDIGTECVKGLIFEKKEGKISVLGSSLEYYDQYSSFLTHQFESEVVKKTILKALEELNRQTGIKKKSAIISLPANVFAGRVVSHAYSRKERGIIEKEEKEIILKDASIQGKKKAAQIYAAEKGILEEDLQIIDFKILETKIDGYRVRDVLGFEGKNVDFRILATLLPKHYFDSSATDFFSPVSAVKELGIAISGIFNEAEGLSRLLAQKPQGVFLDVGGEVVQIFLARNGVFEKISEFSAGGKDFSRVIAERLGLQEPEVRNLKHRYCAKSLSEESRGTLRQFFKTASAAWFDAFKKKLKEMSPGVLPPEIFMFGGGALQPEIEEILGEGDWEDVSFAARPEIKFILPGDLPDIEAKAKNLGTWSVPSLFVCFASRQD